MKDEQDGLATPDLDYRNLTASPLLLWQSTPQKLLAALLQKFYTQ
jgi:hypothetical protein